MFDRRNCDECGSPFTPRTRKHSRCSAECRRAKSKRYSNKWYRANRDGQLVKQKRYYDDWKLAHPGKNYYGTEYRLYYGARERCRHSGMEFTISVTDIVVPERCPILGVKMVRGERYAPSLDRHDSDKGYTPDNIWVISKVANRMKNDSTEEERRKFAEWVNQLKL